MYLKKLVLKNFRNFSDLFLEFCGRETLFTGPNGSGKTNILEAIHLLCTGRSQRNASKGEVIRFNDFFANIEGEFSSTLEPHEHKRFSLTVDREKGLNMTINDNKKASIMEWFGIQPVVSFAADDIELVYGNPERRRRFLDMFISQMNKKYLHALMDYRKSLASRNRILKSESDDVLCEIYEQRMAEAGAVITETRIEAAGQLCRAGSENYRAISAHKDEFSMVYKPDFSYDNSSKNSWKKVFSNMLAETRKRDRILGFSSSGPHRDDLQLFMNGCTAKSYASQGQCRSIAVSLKLSSMECMEKISGESMLLIFDDAVADLDSDRAGRLFSLIENRGQLFVASPQRNAQVLLGASEYRLHEGRAVPA